MSQSHRLLPAIVVATITLAPLVPMAEGAGPWRGQVVDAETGQPLAGVVVLAVWDKVSPGFMHPRRDFHDVDEVVTDSDGHFVIPTRRLLTANPFVSINGPDIYMLKPGYGQWQFRGAREWGQLDLIEQERRSADAKKRFEGNGAVFELPPLRTPKEQRNFWYEPPSGVPHSRVPRYVEAVNQQRALLGLSPLGRGQSGGTP